MKRVAVSTLTAVCGFLLAATAHASYVEKTFVDDPGWKSQEEVDAANGTAVDARTKMTESGTNDEGFDATDDGTDARFGDMLKSEDITIDAETSITRAEFTAMFVRARYAKGSIDSCYWDITSPVPPRFDLLFRDVPVDHRYAPEICVAMRDGLVRGFGNDIFRPDAQITFAEAAKIVARAEGLTPWADPSQPTHWFDVYVSALSRRNAIPMTVEKIEERITTAEAREMIRRLVDDDRAQTSRTADELIAEWEKAHAPRPVVVPRPATPSTPSTTPRSSSAASAATSSSAASSKPSGTLVPTPSSETMTDDGSSSSRPKAWYEF